MKNVIKFLLLAGICIASHCGKKVDSENCHYAINFSNNSKKNLYVRDNRRVRSYPLEIGYLDDTVQDRYKVNVGEKKNRIALLLNGPCWEYMFVGGTPSYVTSLMDTLSVYIFDAEIVEKNSWEIVVKNNLFLKRYDLTLKDLQRLDWKITYPPTEAMKDIEQYPPYGSE